MVRTIHDGKLVVRSIGNSSSIIGGYFQFNESKRPFVSQIPTDSDFILFSKRRCVNMNFHVHNHGAPKSLAIPPDFRHMKTPLNSKFKQTSLSICLDFLHNFNNVWK